MSHPISRWCLQWGRNGELAQSDRQDLLQSLCGPSAVPQQSFYLP